MSLRSLIPIGRDKNVARRITADPFVMLQEEIDRLFDDFMRGWPTVGRLPEFAPEMDVTENDKEIEVTVELPGLEEKDIQINVADNFLTIRGEKRAEKNEETRNYRHYERSYGSFSRTIELPPGIDADAIKASLSKGVLKVTVPKPAPAQVKKVEVKAAA
ncbi:MAG TPA: Hsp20/alpha crystallin family protein [Xanthobacteraceae bacterium]|nr:Hsp20/alpha crystallin family protein [Xanthobacteraceae bacterium]